MILYKYVDATSLNHVLTGKRIMFSHPTDFNDPFDRPRVPEGSFNSEYHSLFTGELMTREKQIEEANAAWGECAVSSFTRNYDNGLMWAHYADKHKGAVIELDADAAGLTSRSFLIPVQFGSVIYMKRPNPEYIAKRPYSTMRSQTVSAGDDRFEIENYERLQRLFLTKGLSWAYEEEVRVVCEPFRYIWNEANEYVTGDWKRVTKPDGHTGYLWRLSPGSIRRIFTGLRFEGLNALRESARAGAFEIMVPDSSSHDDYEVHFRPDGGSDRG